MTTRFLRYSFVKYAIIGVINTLFGYGIIFLLMYFGIIAEIANVIGYGLGILLSYTLNKYFTFKSNNPIKREFVRFCIAMGIAYLINLAILILLHRYYGVDKYISTIIAGVFYTLSGYILAKFYSFKATKHH